MLASPAVLWAETTVRNLGPAPEDTRTSVIHTTVVPAARPHLHHLLRQHYHPAVPWVETTVRSLARARVAIQVWAVQMTVVLAARPPLRHLLRHLLHHLHLVVPWVETTVRSLARAQADILALDDHTIAILAVRQPPRLRHQHHRQHHRQHQHRLHHQRRRHLQLQRRRPSQKLIHSVLKDTMLESEVGTFLPLVIRGTDFNRSSSNGLPQTHKTARFALVQHINMCRPIIHGHFQRVQDIKYRK